MAALRAIQQGNTGAPGVKGAKDDLAKVLAQPDTRTRGGRRDAVLQSVLYDTGARVQELIDMSAGDVRLEPPAQIRLFGKGRKMRAVPLMDATARPLRDHPDQEGSFGERNSVMG